LLLRLNSTVFDKTLKADFSLHYELYSLNYKWQPDWQHFKHVIDPYWNSSWY